MELLTLEQVAQALQVSVQTVRRMIADKEIDAIKIRGQWRVRRDNLEAYIASKSS